MHARRRGGARDLPTTSQGAVPSRQGGRRKAKLAADPATERPSCCAAHSPAPCVETMIALLVIGGGLVGLVAIFWGLCAMASQADDEMDADGIAYRRALQNIDRNGHRTSRERVRKHIEGRGVQR